MEATQIQ